ncbi:MAG: transcriptional repressor NrdR [Dehalococcoidia bacterium]|nr:transcriptional repressor NrdR [Dehalococcoidia bacterium]
MKCPYCGQPASKVIDSRTAESGIRRRRRCEECDERFTTFEQVQRSVVMVVKKDGRREEFSREKLLAGLRIAARKRPLATGAVEAIVEDIEQRLMGSSQGEVRSRVIGEMAISRLKRLDPIAYIRFASVYRQFVSLEEMLEELNRIARSPLGIAPEQAKLFEDELDALMRGAQAAVSEFDDDPPVTEGRSGEADRGSDPDRQPIPIGTARSAQPV